MEPGGDAPALSKAMAVSAFVLWVGVMYFGSCCRSSAIPSDAA
jgi:hypothetical protein